MWAFKENGRLPQDGLKEKKIGSSKDLLERKLGLKKLNMI